MLHDILERVAELDRFVPLFNQTADEVETDPTAWRRLWDKPQLRAIAHIGVPEAMSPYPFARSGLGERCDYPLHLAIVERLARGGASALMTLPAASLSAPAIMRLGAEDQIKRFFAPFRDGVAYTFFAVTEPQGGSDASGCRTKLMADGAGWRITGRKTLIGAAAVAKRGLVLARENGGAILRLAMVTQGQDGRRFTAERLALTGMRGAQPCGVVFNDLPVGQDDILAPDARRPVMLTLIDVFEKHRPLVGAMALGTGRGMLDRLAADGITSPATKRLLLIHAALFERMLGMGRDAEQAPLQIHDVSQFKRQATLFADQVRMRVVALAPEKLLSDRSLRRMWRDASAFEYMEGAAAIHGINAYRDYLTGGIGRDVAS